MREDAYPGAAVTCPGRPRLPVPIIHVAGYYAPLWGAPVGAGPLSGGEALEELVGL